LNLEIGTVAAQATSADQVAHVPCCFDSAEERDSFKAAVEWAVNAKSHVAAFRSKQEEAKKKRETIGMQQVLAEKEEASRLEAELATMKRRVSESEETTSRFSQDRNDLSQSLSEDKASFVAEMQKLAQEQEAIRAQVALDLELSKLSADEAAVRAQSLAESNLRASASVVDMQATVDQKFLEFRKRELSSTTIRTVDVAALQRAEAERLEAEAREQAAHEAQAKAHAESVARLREETRAREEEKRQMQIDSTLEKKWQKDAEMAVKISQAREIVEAAGASAAAVLTESVVPLKERVKMLSEAPTAAPVVTAALKIETEGVEPLKERIKRMSVVPGSPPAPASAAVSLQRGAAGEAPGDSEESPVPLKERMKRFSVVPAAAPVVVSEKPTNTGAQMDSDGAVPIKERMKRFSAVPSPSSASPSDPAGGPPIDTAPADGAVSIKERMKRFSVVPSPSSASPAPPSDPAGGPPIDTAPAAAASAQDLLNSSALQTEAVFHAFETMEAVEYAAISEARKVKINIVYYSTYAP